ncbi:MAG: RNA 2',3'-cyclic phosphodiesterase [Thiogranum sp.]|nr:RNA 2',3'-cyclic phosphodiesterase [Thiogranum sp.]
MTDDFSKKTGAIAEQLSRRGQRLATAESCTGGWVAKVCTDRAGSSAWFDSGFVTYNNAAKQDLLNVSANTLDRYGAVSAPTVQEMAAGALAHSHAEWALAISGIAGPGGGSPEKPVGTVWLAWAGPGGWQQVRQFQFEGDRDAVRRQAVDAALDGLLEQLIATEKTARRLFLALWPSAPVQAQLAAAAARWTHHPVPIGNMHMTLVFLGDCTESQIQCYVEAVSSIQCESFELQLDCLGGLPRRGIRWLGCKRVPEALPALVRDLKMVLRSCGFETDERAFVPHVTLSRKERKQAPETDIEPVSWPVTDFALVESKPCADGVQYAVLQHWEMQKTG